MSWPSLPPDVPSYSKTGQNPQGPFLQSVSCLQRVQNFSRTRWKRGRSYVITSLNFTPKVPGGSPRETRVMLGKGRPVVDIGGSGLLLKDIFTTSLLCSMMRPSWTICNVRHANCGSWHSAPSAREAHSLRIRAYQVLTHSGTRDNGKAEARILNAGQDNGLWHQQGGQRGTVDGLV